jgi:SanA protein
MASTARKRTAARLRTALSLASLDGPRIHREVQQAGDGRVFSLEKAPQAPVALILGAPAREGRVTAVLEDRLLTGARLLERGTVQSLCCTGTPEEVAVMAAFLAEQDVSGSALTLDPHGRHTFESLENARTLGHTELLVVSQGFHLPRALYICRALGLQASGVTADLRPYQSQHRLEHRELFSSVLAYWMCA